MEEIAMSDPQQLEWNKQFVHRFFAAMDAKRFDEMEALLHPEHLFHLPMAREPLNVKTHMEVNKHIQASLPIVKRVFEDQIAERDRVVSRGRLSFQHVGEFNGTPPTDQAIEVSFIHIMRIKDGLNAEEWDEVNFLPLMKALKVVPEDAGINWH
jgi:predicted ester cyclase